MSAQGLVFSGGPSRQVSLDVPQGGTECRGTEAPIVFDPTADVRVEHPRQIIQGLVTAQVRRPATEGSSDRLERRRTGSGTERDAHACGSLAHQPRRECIVEKVELEDRVRVTSAFISAIADFSLVRMKRQPAVRKKPTPDGRLRGACPHLPCSSAPTSLQEPSRHTLAEMPATVAEMAHGSHPAPPDLCRKDRPEPVPPEPDRFMRDVDPPLAAGPRQSATTADSGRPSSRPSG